MVLLLVMTSSKGKRPSWKPTRGEGFESQARHTDAHDVSKGRGVLSSKIQTPNPTREDASLLLDVITAFITKPYHTCGMV